MNTPLFNFQNVKLNTRDIIVVLKDSLNTTSSPLPIPDPHAIRVSSNTLERHSISSRDAPLGSLINSKCEFEVKTMEKQGIGARSLARNTLGGRRAC